jgi:hypothetical protein
MHDLIEAPAVTIEGIDADGGPPCEVRPGGKGPCCGKTAVARVHAARTCCGINHNFFICAPCLTEARKLGIYCSVHVVELAWRET